MVLAAGLTSIEKDGIILSCLVVGSIPFILMLKGITGAVWLKVVISKHQVVAF